LDVTQGSDLDNICQGQGNRGGLPSSTYLPKVKVMMRFAQDVAVINTYRTIEDVQQGIKDVSSAILLATFENTAERNKKGCLIIEQKPNLRNISKIALKQKK